ncbi:hypothetical protein Bca4012_057949 [Brassica carinata]
MVSPSSVTPLRRVTRSQSASDRKQNPKKIRRVGKTAPHYAEMSTESELEEPVGVKIGQRRNQHPKVLERKTK